MDDGSTVYSRATDSLQAIRDNQLSSTDVTAAVPAASTIADAVWNETLVGNTTTAFTFGNQIGQPDWSTISSSDVRAQSDAALEAIQLHRMFSNTGGSGSVANDSFWAKLHSKSTTASYADYNNQTDSLQAIRDNQGSGGSTVTEASIWASTSRTLTSATALSIPSTNIAGLVNLASSDVNAQVLDVVNVDALVAGVTITEALRRNGALLSGSVSGAGSTDETFNDWSTSANTIVVHPDNSGNRSPTTFN